MERDRVTDAVSLSNTADGTLLLYFVDEVALYSQEYWWFVWEIPVFALMGVLGGFLGVLFVKLNLQVMKLRARFIPGAHKHKRMIEVSSRVGQEELASCDMNSYSTAFA